MKYSKEMYLDSGFYGEDMDGEIENAQEKVVRCRKSHKCVGGCKTEIQAGNFALLETGFLEGKPVFCYTCLSCIETWLEETGQADCDDEVN